MARLRSLLALAAAAMALAAAATAAASTVRDLDGMVSLRGGMCVPWADFATQISGSTAREVLG